MIFTVWIITILAFAVIQLPPGDYVTSLVSQMLGQGVKEIKPEVIEQMREQYGLNDPLPVQYLKWMRNIITKGDFGYSLTFKRDASALIFERLPMTFAVTLTSVLFIWVVSLPIGIYSAVYKYSLGDYIATFLGMIGLAVPSFLLALILLYYSNRWFGVSIGGLYDPKFSDKPWTWPKIQSLLSHLVVPTIVIGLSGTAAMIRRMRANLLDELGKQYYVTAKAKGLPHYKALLKYPFRMSLNPFIADIGNLLPHLVSGSVLVSLVLSLPTVGPILLPALKSQDQFLAGFILMFVAVLTVFGMLISDLLLAWLDPRIRIGGGR